MTALLHAADFIALKNVSEAHLKNICTLSPYLKENITRHHYNAYLLTAV
jgi:hypothetical protein